MGELSHFDETGASRMVDVGQKAVTSRMARAACYVTMEEKTLQLISESKIAKGDVFEVARLAGIMASKQTANLIPLCHPLGLDSVTIDFEIQDSRTLKIEAKVTVEGKTGVEMEALTAVNISALTIYDMCKSVDRSIIIGPSGLVEKDGGKSGHYLRNEDFYSKER